MAVVRKCGKYADFSAYSGVFARLVGYGRNEQDIDRKNNKCNFMDMVTLPNHVFK